MRAWIAEENCDYITELGGTPPPFAEKNPLSSFGRRLYSLVFFVHLPSSSLPLVVSLTPSASHDTILQRRFHHNDHDGEDGELVMVIMMMMTMLMVIMVVAVVMQGPAANPAVGVLDAISHGLSNIVQEHHKQRHSNLEMFLLLLIT